MEIDDEYEIKIEYYDLQEDDPLCESYGHTVEVNNTFEIQQNKIGVQNSDDITEVHLSNTQTNVHDNWYEEIDSNRKYKCKFCDLNYTSIQTIRYHMKTKHSEKLEVVKSSLKAKMRERRLKCHLCKEQFKTIEDIKCHLLSHPSLNVCCTCLYCDASFGDLNELLLHQQNIHQVYKKSFVCSICGYHTLKKSHFTQHQKTHLEKTGLKCSFCDYMTNYPPNLKIHERIHTNFKPYKCDYLNCEYSCSSKSSLRSHRLKHFPDKNILYCDKCCYKTVYKQSLKKHKDSHSRNKITIKVYEYLFN